MYRVIKASMAPEEVERAIEQNKPFNLDSFRNYRGYDAEHQRKGVLKAKDIKVGETYINTDDAAEFDIGDKFTVLDIDVNDPDTKAGYLGEYTFHIADLTTGTEFEVHFDADDYVGTRA